ncbi:MAG: PEP-CTERM/exosortase system-associated acyltransferase, partial [Parahaliea sp.]
MNGKVVSLASDFKHFFDVCIASTPERLAEVYGLRYRVYCEEFGYEAGENFPNRQESDEFDGLSLHCLLIHKPSGLSAGCVRLVLGSDSRQLPMEKFCREAIEPDRQRSLAYTRSMACEVSRLAVDKRFRRRAGEDMTRFGRVLGSEASERELRTFPLIAVAAYLSACALADLVGRRIGLAMMEPFLPRLLLRSGIRFEQIGRAIDYHGLRAPSVALTESGVRGRRADLRELSDALHTEFAHDLSPSREQLRAGEVPLGRGARQA